MRRPGLRTKVMAGFAAGALGISSAVAGLSYDLTRRTLLNNRERSATRAAYFDATAVQAGLASDHPDIIEVLRSLDTGGSRRALLHRDGQWYARTADTGVTAAIPLDLRALVTAGRPGMQRVRTEAGTAVVIGIPLSESTQFYVLDSLRELENTLRVLALVLTIVAAGTTAAGAGLGAYVTRRVMRPLASIAEAALDITGGNLHARLDPAAEPELARLTNSFNQMVDQLAQRIERDRRFAADVSHELRSPLQTLAAAVSVLSRRADLDDRTGRAVGLITDEVARFQSLVTDLLELARGDQEPELGPVNILDFARNVCRVNGVSDDAVVLEAGTDPIWQVDRRRLGQVLANLLDNAQRHGGGVSAVRLGQRAAGVWRLDVDDRGPGVPAGERQAIFDRFVRGSTAKSRGGSAGTGLGLALVAQHVAGHGGRVHVTDRPGGGARFRVELPRRVP